MLKLQEITEPKHLDKLFRNWLDKNGYHNVEKGSYVYEHLNKIWCGGFLIASRLIDEHLKEMDKTIRGAGW